MYAALWRILPGPAWVRVLILLALLAAAEERAEKLRKAMELYRKLVRELEEQECPTTTNPTNPKS